MRAAGCWEGWKLYHNTIFVCAIKHLLYGRQHNLSQLFMILIRTLGWTLALLNITIVGGFLPLLTRRRAATCVRSFSEGNGGRDRPKACLVGTSHHDENFSWFRYLLEQKGFEFEIAEEDVSLCYRYKFQKASGMLQLVATPEPVEADLSRDIPRWIPLVKDEENVLVANGWSFLDPDENEPLSSFDIDAANIEGTYRPKWGISNSDSFQISSLGFHRTPVSYGQVLDQASSIIRDDITRAALLEGATDPPYRKLTHNGFGFSGSAGQADIPRGIFVGAIGGLPLFSSFDLSPSTGSSGWLSFVRPLAEDHVCLIYPAPDAADKRIEVICAKTKCHLGHFFGRSEGYCINASALNFISERETKAISSKEPIAHPFSWRLTDSRDLVAVKQLRNVLDSLIPTEKIVLGAGCFWHVEAALRRLPGVVSTKVGYAGGKTANPNYEELCYQDTGHAEVVLVEFDASIIEPRVLIDCFLAIHDPTKVRAHGKHALYSGQYRSCIFLPNLKLAEVVQRALMDCQAQLNRELSTELQIKSDDLNEWFWEAEERHQLHEQRRPNNSNSITTLAVTDWLEHFGRRSQSIYGSAETLNRSGLYSC